MTHFKKLTFFKLGAACPGGLPLCSSRDPNAVTTLGKRSYSYGGHVISAVRDKLVIMLDEP